MKAKELTLNAILIALTIIILFLNNIMPISTFTFLTIASLLIPIAIIRASVMSAFLVYISSSILGFLLLPKNIVILYFIFFGIYGIIKYYLEKINKYYLELILKLIFFNIILFISFFFLSQFINVNQNKMPQYLLFLIAQAAFLIYDYALTVLISWYLSQIHKRI
ncbi:hypothetical protein [Caproiciproducens sp. MSJ-32]|uniref:hypothetical protein n=1 Tax=Caproiciproducens sp. MSJ-32 TaxID=2841527 RepID=UPI001C11D8BD|nr:hypothetical protein [Caproiciproducens sp. MSJ-32]MBU5455185.1 hypothetical protein [Caproiciproducens sp. MSJ-32]